MTFKIGDKIRFKRSCFPSDPGYKPSSGRVTFDTIYTLTSVDNSFGSLSFICDDGSEDSWFNSYVELVEDINPSIDWFSLNKEFSS